MPGANFAIDQDWSPMSPGSPGIARKDLRLARTIFPRIVTSGNTAFLWTLTTPAGSTATLTGATTATPNFTPDVLGPYRLTLRTNGGGAGNVMTRICGVRYDTSGVLQNDGWMMPAFKEEAGESNWAGNEQGWETSLEFMLFNARARIAALEAVTPPGGSTNVLVFQPGGVAGFNVYNDETALQTAFVNTKGRVTVVLDDLFAPINFSNTFDWGFRVDWVAVPQTLVTTDPGVQIAGVISMDGIHFLPDTSLAPCFFESVAFPAIFLRLKGASNFDCGNAAFETVNQNVDMYLYMAEDSNIGQTNPTIHVNGKNLYVTLESGASMKGNSITGGAGHVYVNQNTFRGGMNSTQPGYTGTLEFFGIKPDVWAANVTYNAFAEVLVGGVFYKSLQGGNLNKPPAANPAWWYAL